jgi:hypothetical protein
MKKLFFVVTILFQSWSYAAATSDSNDIAEINSTFLGSYTLLNNGPACRPYFRVRHCTFPFDKIYSVPLSECVAFHVAPENSKIDLDDIFPELQFDVYNNVAESSHGTNWSKQTYFEKNKIATDYKLNVYGFFNREHRSTIVELSPDLQTLTITYFKKASGPNKTSEIICRYDRVR